MPRSSDWPPTGILPDRRSSRARLISTESGSATAALFTKSRLSTLVVLVVNIGNRRDIYRSI